MTAKDILLAVIIPLALAEVGPWCSWLAARLLPSAAKLRYGDTERAAVRLEEWSGDLNDIPGQLTKLAYAVGQLAAGSAVSARRRTKGAMRKIDAQRRTALPDRDRMPELDRSAVVDGLRSLPDLQREAIVLRYYADLSEAEIAKNMGISKPAVRSHTARGMQTLRSILEYAP